MVDPLLETWQIHDRINPYFLGALAAPALASAPAAGGRIKGFKPHVHAFVGYLISHESHHRGQAAMVLKAAGAPLDKKIAFGLWEWGVR